MVHSPSKREWQPVSTESTNDVDTNGRSERRRGARHNTGRRHNRELLLRCRAAQLGCPNPLGWGAKPFPSGSAKTPVEEEKASMLLSPVAMTPPPRDSVMFSPETGEKDLQENDSQTGAAFRVIREALGLKTAMEGKPNDARLALTSLENFNAAMQVQQPGPVLTDPAVLAAQPNPCTLNLQDIVQKPDATQVPAILNHPTVPTYHAPENFPVVVPPPTLPIAPVAAKPTLTALDPELGLPPAPQPPTPVSLGHIELSMPPTLPSPVGSQVELSSISAISEASTPMAWTRDEVSVEDSWSTLQATLGMISSPGALRRPANSFEASLLAATSAAAAAPPPPPPIAQNPWWATPQQNPPLSLASQIDFPAALQQYTVPAPAAPAPFPPAGYPAQPAAWPAGGWGDSMESHKAVLAAAVQASGLGGINTVQPVPVEVPVEAEQLQPTGKTTHKAAYRRPTDDEIAAKLSKLQKQPRVDLCRQITDQEITDRLLNKVKPAAAPEPMLHQATGSPVELESQRIRI